MSKEPQKCVDTNVPIMGATALLPCSVEISLPDELDKYMRAVADAVYAETADACPIVTAWAAIAHKDASPAEQKAKARMLLEAIKTYWDRNEFPPEDDPQDWVKTSYKREVFSALQQLGTAVLEEDQANDIWEPRQDGEPLIQKLFDGTGLGANADDLALKFAAAYNVFYEGGFAKNQMLWLP